MKLLALLGLLLQLNVGVVAAQEAEPDQAPPETAFVRVTHYVLCCRTANGEQVYAGSTACSFNFPFGTRFTFADGTSVVCNDRGLLYYNPRIEDGWLDVWTSRRDLDGHATVTVERP